MFQANSEKWVCSLCKQGWLKRANLKFKVADLVWTTKGYTKGVYPAIVSVLGMEVQRHALHILIFVIKYYLTNL